MGSQACSRGARIVTGMMLGRWSLCLNLLSFATYAKARSSRSQKNLGATVERTERLHVLCFKAQETHAWPKANEAGTQPTLSSGPHRFPHSLTSPFPLFLVAKCPFSKTEGGCSAWPHGITPGLAGPWAACTVMWARVALCSGLLGLMQEPQRWVAEATRQAQSLSSCKMPR